VEINGAIRDVLELTRDEVTKNGVSFSKRCDAMAKGDREVPLHVFLRRPTPRVRRAPRGLIEDGRDARAHSAF
jgi:hypothetical protein